MGGGRRVVGAEIYPDGHVILWDSTAVALSGSGLPGDQLAGEA